MNRELSSSSMIFWQLGEPLRSGNPPHGQSLACSCTSSSSVASVRLSVIHRAAVPLIFVPHVMVALWVPATALTILSIKNIVFSNSDAAAILSITSSSLSIAANLLATGMIGFTAYRHGALSAKSGLKLDGTKILILLTESGLLYAALQIVRLGLAASVVPSTPPYGSLNTATYVFERTSFVVSSMYTPALIIIIHHRYSFTDTVQLSGVDLEDDFRSDGRGFGKPREDVISEIRFRESAPSDTMITYESSEGRERELGGKRESQ
jgi:hypothetical protein